MIMMPAPGQLSGSGDVTDVFSCRCRLAAAAAAWSHESRRVRVRRQAGDGGRRPTVTSPRRRPGPSCGRTRRVEPQAASLPVSVRLSLAGRGCHESLTRTVTRSLSRPGPAGPGCARPPARPRRRSVRVAQSLEVPAASRRGQCHFHGASRPDAAPSEDSGSGLGCPRHRGSHGDRPLRRRPRRWLSKAGQPAPAGRPGRSSPQFKIINCSRIIHYNYIITSSHISGIQSKFFSLQFQNQIRAERALRSHYSVCRER
jgi:hypothetical protein